MRVSYFGPSEGCLDFICLHLLSSPNELWCLSCFSTEVGMSASLYAQKSILVPKKLPYAPLHAVGDLASTKADIQIGSCMCPFLYHCFYFQVLSPDVFL